MKNLIIIGLSKTANHVYQFVKHYNLYNVIGFAVNEKYKKDDYYEGLPVYSVEKLRTECPLKDFEVFVALLWNHLNRDRKELYTYCKEHNYKMANIISPTAILRSKLMGDNCWVHDYVIVQNNVDISSNVFIMAYTLLGANSTIGAHCFFGARSLLGGGCIIGQQSFVGLSSTIFDDTHIGNKCIIGACTAVKRNIPDNSRYITSSSDISIKTYSATEIEDKLIFSLNKR